MFLEVEEGGQDPDEEVVNVYLIRFIADLPLSWYTGSVFNSHTDRQYIVPPLGREQIGTRSRYTTHPWSVHKQTALHVVMAIQTQLSTCSAQKKIEVKCQLTPHTTDPLVFRFKINITPQFNEFRLTVTIFLVSTNFLFFINHTDE